MELNYTWTNFIKYVYVIQMCSQYAHGQEVGVFLCSSMVESRRN